MGLTNAAAAAIQGVQGPAGQDGADGSSCTVLNIFGIKTIACDDGTSQVVSDGADGADGQDGAQGPQGVQGPAGISGLVTVTDQSPINSVNKNVDVECPAGTKILGGGATLIGGEGFVALDLSNAIIIGGFPDTWRGGASEINPTASNWSIIVRAICATVS